MIESLVNDIYELQEEDATVLITDAKAIDLDEKDIQCPWLLPLLLGNDVHHLAQQWQIGFDGTCLVTRHGRVGGSLQTNTRAVTTNTSGRNIYQQSFLEGSKRFKDKCLEGYHTEGVDNGLIIKPMLAYEYSITGKQIKDWDQIYYQPKLDGVRCLMSKQPIGIVKTSRGNRSYSFMSHLDNQCSMLMSVLPSGMILDGELYNHQLTFEEITSIARRTKNPHPNERSMQFWVFDLLPCGTNLKFEERYTLLYNAYEQVKEFIPDIIMVPLYMMQPTDDIGNLIDVFVSNKYEGLMLRKMGAGSEYVMGRCNNILKVKKFKTDEGYVIEVFAGTGTEADCALFTIYDYKTGVSFPIRPSGSFEQRRKWLQDPNMIINRLYTYKYFSKSEDMVPRFPTGVGFRDYE